VDWVCNSGVTSENHEQLQTCLCCCPTLQTVVHTTTFRRFSVLFQVNASGQFCGVAEMVGPVDFGKSVEYWQQDKWNGRFTVKWHIIKDIPNCQFRHIILENNDNKPVTNSRDTQEVINPSLFGYIETCQQW